MTKEMNQEAENWYSEDRATFGDRLAAARDAAGLSQKELAAQIGVKTAVIRAWEDDVKEPRANRLQMLSGMLGISLSWLLTGAGEAPVMPEDDAAISADVSELLAEMRALRVQVTQTGERIAQLEKRLRATLGNSIG